MKDGYFHRVSAQSGNRLWINNPTLEEAEKAMEAGAISCTTNPAFAAKIIREESEREQALREVERAIAEAEDDGRAAVLVQQKLVRRLALQFLSLYERNPGREGYVSIQGGPHAEENADSIIAEALEAVRLSPNIIAKIPVTEAGLKAMGYLFAENIPVIATEIMGISQAIAVCELHRRISERTGRAPPLYVTHITGIFDEYLHKVAQQEEIHISRDILWQAGCAVARKQYRILKDRGYPVVMLGGGARGIHHFTEMVGSDMHVTVNWRGTADQLIEADPPVLYRMDTPVPGYVIVELLEKLPDFQRAYSEDGLEIEEYMDFGPVKFFRAMFLKGWDELVNTVREQRRGGGHAEFRQEGCKTGRGKKGGNAARSRKDHVGLHQANDAVPFPFEKGSSDSPASPCCGTDRLCSFGEGKIFYKRRCGYCG